MLVNNDGIAWTGPTLDMLLDVLQTMLRVNVEGVFIVSRAVLPPHMITQRLAPSPRLRGEGWDEGLLFVAQGPAVMARPAD